MKTNIQHLLTLPPCLVEDFMDFLKPDDPGSWYCTCDPVGRKLGSGGGTAALMRSWRRVQPGNSGRKRIIMHAGGQSRRLPAYAPWGKILTPIPVFRWKRGQKLGQTLLDLQVPLYEEMMAQAPKGLKTLIASGDVYIRAPKGLGRIPDADVVCFGLWTDPQQATRHGVFASRRDNPSHLDFMLQKPTMQQLQKLSSTHLFMMDIGIWLLSDKALQLLEKRATLPDGQVGYYDMYSDFGGALGDTPRIADDELNSLKVAVVTLEDGEFYHYGTSRELLSSTVAVQNLVNDQRRIMTRKIKPEASIFTANSLVSTTFTPEHRNIWIENSCVGPGWKLTRNNIVTGVPQNDWKITLPEGACLDIVRLKSGKWAVRAYGYDDTMRGAMDNGGTCWMGKRLDSWNLGMTDADIQQAPIYPVTSDFNELNMLAYFMVNGDESCRPLWERCTRISADEIAAQADLKAIDAQRRSFRSQNWLQLAQHWDRSVFYQLDLDNAASELTAIGVDAPEPLPREAPVMSRIHNRMLSAAVKRRKGESGWEKDENEAFDILREGIVAPLMAEDARCTPVMSVYTDQIVWARSPVRIDLAGGWTDTPPYPLLAGGAVVNLAVELNGQPPLQAYVKPCSEHHIVLRSIDLGASETIRTYDELHDYRRVGSPFSIPKAALTLAGFSDEFGRGDYPTLEARLQAFGSGLEVTLLSAVPAGSGVGTSSILAATVLAALSDFCGLGWDRNEICRRSMALEQLLTTGGGWQDQYGGVMPGIKLLQTEPGMRQQPEIDWLPDRLFQLPEYKGLHLLYYTGITRTAKSILAEIVRGMFLNSGPKLDLLDSMKDHALEMARAIRRCDFEQYCRLVAKTWEQNMRLDAGTNPPEVAAIIERVRPWLAACKLPGAGGGGFIYMVARDEEAAAAVRRTLTAAPPNPRARFVEMSISNDGLVVSRS